VAGIKEIEMVELRERRSIVGALEKEETEGRSEGGHAVGRER
jgi:hypothetical protein